MFPLALMAVGIGLNAYANYKAAQAQAAQARENARRAKMMADDALQRGEQKAGMVELAGSMRQGAQLAGYGYAGVDPTSGSAARTISTTALVGALDAAIARNNAFREAFGYQLQQRSFDQAAQATEQAATLNLFAAIFGGAGQLAAAGGAPAPATSGGVPYSYPAGYP